jgi:uncharacterized radical SAM protein YgiQ
MYGMDCTKRSTCIHHCLGCSNLDRSHLKLISLLKKAREIPGVKKVFVRSGIRYDLALSNPRYIQELSEHHISGCLKIAPEHFSPKVTKLMNKDNSRFQEFLTMFTNLNKNKKQFLTYYFMLCHPGDDVNETLLLRDFIRKKNLKNVEQFQVFTPTPMTNSTCMYWTKMNPQTMEKIDVICDYKTKKQLKRIMLGASHFSKQSKESQRQ